MKGLSSLVEKEIILQEAGSCWQKNQIKKKKQREVNGREKLGCIISKDRQNNWVVTGMQAEMVGKKK